MALDSKHPLYRKFLPIWKQTVDTYKGEQCIKSEGTTYLPATSGQIADGFEKSTKTPGYKAYDAYRRRAVFPDIYRDAIVAAVGIMHSKPPVIELPSSMESLRDKATVRGESLELLLRRINEAQLKTGRIGLLADLPNTTVQGPIIPYIAIYEALSIINWDDGMREDPSFQNLNLVVLDESENERITDLEWEFRRKFRVLILGDVDINEGRMMGVYRQGLFRENARSGLQFSEALLTEPNLQGNMLNFIPFTFINSMDLLPDPDNPPLLGLSNLALTIYRGEADYRQSLFMQGQDTLVTIGANIDDEESLKVGATGRIDVPKGGDAKFIGVDSSGLSEQREALRNDRNDARELGGKLLDQASRQRESSDSLRIRVAAQTATLANIALAGAEGLQTQLRFIARWLGADPASVVVEPNLDFDFGGLTPKDIVDYMAAKNTGGPLSLETIHDQMRKHDITKFNFDEEVEKIESEMSLTFGRGQFDDFTGSEETETQSGQAASSGTEVA